MRWRHSAKQASLKNMVRRFQAAWNFLTVLPPGPKHRVEPDELSQSMAFFPIAGSALALLPAIFIFIFYPFVPPFLGALFIVFIFTVSTGGLHIDGLADTVDGFAGGSGRNEILSVMRDSRTGTMGVLAIVFIIAFKIAFLNAIWMTCDKRGLIKTVLLFPALSRWCMVNAALHLPYAGSEGGLGETFAKRVTVREWLAATFFSVILAGIILKLYALLLLPLVYLTGLFLIKYFKRRIAGITGDMFGALNEVAEAASLAYILLIINI